MGLIAKNEGDSYPLVPAGTHHAICVGLIDIGTHHNEKFNKYSHEVVIIWELPEEKITIDGQELPRIISKRYTLSLNEKANLYKDITSWRGRAFTAEESRGFDLKNILGVNCMLQIIHNSKDNKTYANITAILPLFKQIAAIRPTTQPMYFSFMDCSEIPESFPDWIKALITSSAEWTKMKEQGISGVGSGDVPLKNQNPLYDDNCPF